MSRRLSVYVLELTSGFPVLRGPCVFWCDTSLICFQGYKAEPVPHVC